MTMFEMVTAVALRTIGVLFFATIAFAFFGWTIIALSSGSIIGTVSAGFFTVLGLVGVVKCARPAKPGDAE